MNRTIRTTAAALGVGALLAGGLAVTSAVAAPDDTGTAGASFGMGSGYGPGGRGMNGQGMQAGTGLSSGTTAQTGTATAELAADLAFTREEEKMARDLYAAIADLYDGARPFSMITNSEQQHYDAVGTLLDRYGIDDPAGTEAGVFSDAAIQDLYDAWWARAQTSLDEAYQVGIELEQRDIADLEAMLAADYPSDVDTVLSRLLGGSNNHLAAFQRAADGDLGTGTGPQGSQQRGAGMMNGAGYDGDCPMVDDSDT